MISTQSLADSAFQQCATSRATGKAGNRSQQAATSMSFVWLDHELH
jgi:hypothetical protein